VEQLIVGLAAAQAVSVVDQVVMEVGVAVAAAAVLQLVEQVAAAQ
jgi:hypothetical protein